MKHSPGRGWRWINEEARSRIEYLEQAVNRRRIFIGGGAIVALSPFLTLMRGDASEFSLEWGSIFLIIVGLFTIGYALMSNRKDDAEKIALQEKLADKSAKWQEPSET